MNSSCNYRDLNRHHVSYTYEMVRGIAMEEKKYLVEVAALYEAEVLGEGLASR